MNRSSQLPKLPYDNLGHPRHFRHFARSQSESLAGHIVDSWSWALIESQSRPGQLPLMRLPNRNLRSASVDQ
jgi:hypothetical protein